MTKLEKEYIKLTQDMVPIHYDSTKMDCQAFFVCPLPKNYKEALRILGYEKIKQKIDELINKINEDAQKRNFPFENILIGLYGKDLNKEEIEYLKYKKLTKNHLHVDEENGLGGVWAGSDVNSGDIYLITEHHITCDFVVYGFREYFEEGVAYHCHNVDWYWQALLTRELCIRWFNYLVEILMKNKI